MRVGDRHGVVAQRRPRPAHAGAHGQMSGGLVEAHHAGDVNAERRRHRLDALVEQPGLARALQRPPPERRDGGLLPRAAADVGLLPTLLGDVEADRQTREHGAVGIADRRRVDPVDASVVLDVQLDRLPGDGLPVRPQQGRGAAPQHVGHRAAFDVSLWVAVHGAHRVAVREPDAQIGVEHGERRARNRAQRHPLGVRRPLGQNRLE